METCEYIISGHTFKQFAKNDLIPQGTIPIMEYSGMLGLIMKGVSFSGCRYVEGVPF